ncbi:MAG: calcineurin, partial [Myxococcales bacterium FL481]
DDDDVTDDGSGVEPEPEHIIAFGDVHGDYENTLAVLRQSGVIDDDGHWSIGETVVVQVGDQLDRGYGEEEILDLFERLRVEARSAGGAFYALIGNHETLNVEGEMDYVFDESAFGGLAARTQAFAPGGEWAIRLAKRVTVLQLGESVFVHGGVRPEYAEVGVETINAEVRRWLTGETPMEPDSVYEDEGVVWTRTYSDGNPGGTGCSELEEALDLMGATRMVVAHTVQDEGINAACEERVWRVDVGIAEYYDGVIEALEITGDVVSVIRENY